MSNSKQQGGGHGHHRRPPCELKKGPFPPGSVPWCGHALRQLPARCPAAFPRDWLLLTACVCMLLLLLQGLLSSPFAAGGDATWQGRRRVLRERVHCTAPRRAGRVSGTQHSTAGLENGSLKRSRPSRLIEGRSMCPLYCCQGKKKSILSGWYH